MTALAKPKPMTVREFLAWADQQPEGKFELHDGAIVAMAPERAGHAQDKRRMTNALEDAIRQAGIPCQAFVDGIGIAINDYTTYIPDALVNCGEPLPRDAMLAANPVIVVEVFSPSSASRDQVVKMRHYFMLPSIQHYLTVHGEQREIFHHARGLDGTFISSLAGDTLRLDPPGIVLNLTGIFDSDRG
jgi:Uma2 family endonuclease